MLYVNPLSEEERVTLEEMHKNHPLHWTRIRAHALLLSAQGYRVQAIAKLYKVCRQTVSTWIKMWEREGLVGLVDKARSGRPRQLTPVEEEEVLKCLQEDPRSIKRVLAELSKRWGIEVSRSTIKRLCKRAGLSWKRVRKSLKQKRDPEAFEKACALIEELMKQEAKKELDLYYFDESGFTLVPSVPYAWQPIGEHLEIPSSHSQRLNVVGFMNRDCHFESFVFEGSINSAVVVACLDEFVTRIEKKTVIIMDNAPVHTSDEFDENMEAWNEKGLFIEFIPPYSPELNLIEILWRKIKYEWLPFSAYDSFSSLKDKLFEVLRGIGEDFVIEFA